MVQLNDYAHGDLWTVIHLYGIYLPEKSSHWLTKTVMLDMVLGRIFSVKVSEIRLKSCAKVPVKGYLMAEINRIVAQAFGPDKVLPAPPNRLPDAVWLVNVLSTLAPHHEIF